MSAELITTALFAAQWLSLVGYAITREYLTPRKERTLSDTLNVLNRIGADQRVVAERHWRERSQVRVAQAPCDVGLFSDDAKQADLFTATPRKD